MYWTAYKNDAVQPRWCLRPDMLQAIPGTGVEVAARKPGFGAETEFKLPWVNFPDFKPALGEVIALDAELCYSDGKQRVERTFAYGSPLSVTQPASQAKVQLVDKLTLDDWRQCGPVMFPVRCDTAWKQVTKTAVTGHMAIPPNVRDSVSKVVFRLLDTQGEQVADYEGVVQTLEVRRRFLWRGCRVADGPGCSGSVLLDGDRLRPRGEGASPCCAADGERSHAAGALIRVRGSGFRMPGDLRIRRFQNPMPVMLRCPPRPPTLGVINMRPSFSSCQGPRRSSSFATSRCTASEC